MYRKFPFLTAAAKEKKNHSLLSNLTAVHISLIQKLKPIWNDANIDIIDSVEKIEKSLNANA